MTRKEPTPPPAGGVKPPPPPAPPGEYVREDRVPAPKPTPPPSGVAVAEWLTAAEAQAQFLVPIGMAWDEEQQKPIPRGEAIELAKLDKPLDLEQNLQQYAVMRKQVLKFIGEQLVEAEYDSKGYPLPGKVNDYYQLPNYDKKQLAKVGAEKISSFFRFFAGPITLVSQAREKDYCDATVSIVLLDHFGRTVGSAISSCSTAESGFQGIGSKRKYGGYYVKENGRWVERTAPDFRAALNDVTARARKRALVQAVIVATCTDEIFEAAKEDEPERKTSTDLPTKMTIGKLKDTKLTQIDTDTLMKCAKWCRENNKHEKLAEACELIVDERRENLENGDPEPY
ncbi:hypothetical protein LCGC14_2622500 [marine sediment metagenome]|uniref:Uncharacterized protein n=1 Tax=marine sediment metagenome TaxID=412755 RepID=A0A0F9CDQ7_9ZZZZ